MLISGHCQCGNISFILECLPDPIEIPARACTCSFCASHKGVWSSLPNAKLAVRIKNHERIDRHTFATGTAEFHICKRCGDVPFVSSRIEGSLFAVVNVNMLQGVSPSLFEHSQADFDGEAVDDRLERRRQRWIADVSITGASGSEA
jgi:hypothetical protein